MGGVVGQMTKVERGELQLDWMNYLFRSKGMYDMFFRGGRNGLYTLCCNGDTTHLFICEEYESTTNSIF